MSDRLIEFGRDSCTVGVPAELIAATQALELRMRAGEICETEVQPPLQEMCGQVFANYEFLEEDRALEPDLRRFFALIQDRAWSLYE
jgi:histidine ammonia-lyase